MSDVFSLLEELDARRCTLFSEPTSGLRAILVLDDLTLGPAAGGVRTARYASFEAALRDAKQLARAMTLKCALADLGTGGGKIVVLEHDELDRPKAFEALGAHIETLDGLMRTSGDYGTTQDDLRAMARKTRYVQSDEPRLARAVARGVHRCLEALFRHRGEPTKVEGRRLAIQGCGVIGAAVAKLLGENGAELVVADLVPERAERVAAATGADIVPADGLLGVDVDVLVPCAVGNWLGAEEAGRLAARAVCGPATNLLVDLEAARRLAERGVLHVPDAITSAGAVIEGIGRTVMGLPDRTPLLDHLGTTAEEVLDIARDRGITAHEAAEALAESRLAAARAKS
jgi:leucine dehydrogenase